MQQHMFSEMFSFGCGLVSIFDGDQKFESVGNLAQAAMEMLPQNQTVEMVMGRRLGPAIQKKRRSEKTGRAWAQYPVISR